MLNLVEPDKDSEIKSAGRKISVQIPKGAVSEPARVELVEHSTSGSTGMRMVKLFELNAQFTGSNKRIAKFNQELTIAIKHEPRELTGLNVDSLRLYYLDETKKQWVPISSSKYDRQTMVLTATVDHFSFFGEQADPIFNGPGRILAAETNLQTGAAVFKYPVELPPGPGGFQPQLDLVYDSRVADEMKNKRAAGSWVGIGWALHLGRIYSFTEDEEEEGEKKYFLEMGNNSYRLEKLDATNYRVVPDIFWIISRNSENGNTWEARDPYGNYYRFGGTPDSEQYVYDTPANDYYRWDLSLFKDSNGNQATVGYVRDIYDLSVRSAYPQYMKYNNDKIKVQFNSSYDVDMGNGPLRFDNPIFPVPKVIENRKLNSIEIKVNDVLLRKYVFTYITTAWIGSTDYGLIGYSGKHTLSTVTQIGADGTSQLPAMSLTYQDKQTYRKVADEYEYSGNPGNPASLSWPHLTAINSGYGGTISFDYTQIPDTTADSIWTRQAVTSKIVDSGIDLSVPTKLLGANDAAAIGPTGASYLVMDKWLAVATDNVTQIRVKCTVAGNVKVALYSDNAGSPGNLLSANNCGSAVVAGWNKINLPPTPVTSDTNYWIAYNSSANCVGYFSDTGGGLKYRALAYSADFPSPAGTGFTTSANNHPLTAAWACDIQKYTYNYYGNPQYLGSDWDQLYRGFAQASEFDSAGDNVTHWFYATGTANGKNAEQLRGMEYKTQWRDATGQVLRERLYDWTNAQSGQILQLLPSPVSAGKHGTEDGQLNNPVPNPAGIVVSDNDIYVVDPGNQRVQKFFINGDYISYDNQWGSYGTEDRQFDSPSGIAISTEEDQQFDYVYVVDSGNHRIQKFRINGPYIDYISQWGSYGNGNGEFKNPSGIALLQDEYGRLNIYVVDSGNHRVQKFRFNGGYFEYVSQWGGYGTGNGQFNSPSSIAIRDGYIYVVDSGNHRVQQFQINGDYIQYLSQWGGYGTGNGQFNNPGGINVRNGYIYVVDSGNHRVQKFQINGGYIQYVSQWGGYGSGNGQFNSPCSIAVRSGYIYVVDSGNHRVQQFQINGDYINYISQWGGYGTGNGQFNNSYPSQSAIAVSSDSYLYIADTGNHRVQKLDAVGIYCSKWGGYGSGNGQLNNPGGIAVSSDGNVYVVDTSNQRVQKFTASGNYVSQWGGYGSGNGQFNRPGGIATSSDGSVYVVDSANHRIQKFNLNGDYISQWGGCGTGYEQFNNPGGIAVSSDGNVYVVDTGNQRVQKFTASGNYISQWGGYGTGNGQFNHPGGIVISSYGKVYVVDSNNSRVQMFDMNGAYLHQLGSHGSDEGQFNNPGNVAYVFSMIYVTASQDKGIRCLDHVWTVQLSKVENTIPKAARVRYGYDDYGNKVHEYIDGDLGTSNDDASVHSIFYPNTDNATYILRLPAQERVYATITGDVGGSNLRKETSYYYDGNNTSLVTPPIKGNLTRLEQKTDASNSVSSYFTYDSYGNKLTSQDPNGNITTFTFEANYHTYPVTMLYPITGFSESYTYDPGTKNLTSSIDVNGQTTTYVYDMFKRLTKTIKPGDSSQYPSAEYQYNNWGTLNQQHVKTLTKITDGNYLWQSNYFDGLGRTVQTHTIGETGRTIISGTTIFNSRGLADRQYVSQDLDSMQINGYKTPEAAWKYTSYAYDGLNRVTTRNNADDTTISNAYSNSDWLNTVTNQSGFKKRYYYDFFERLIKIEELDNSHALYATTNYMYDVLGNLVQMKDNSNNTTSIIYDCLSRKISMADPDMGSWNYGYDANGNLISQTDAKNQTISLTYDALNRLTAKSYPQGSGMTDVIYTYDSIADGNYGKGQRTGMADAPGTASYKYDARSRLIEEKRTADSVDYVTGFAYDAADRLTSLTYPTGETLTNGYNGRDLPYSLSGSIVGNLVTSMLYNGLGLTTEINLGNGARTTFGYWGTGGGHDTPGGFYGRLWEIKTAKQPGSSPVLMDVKYTWDAEGNLTQRENLVASETETFGYDFLDRLVSASGPYSETYTYDKIGNITSKGGLSYTYGSKPHAVTAFGSTNYAYDNNGNMTTRGSQTLTWDVENRLATVSDNGAAQFVYDGDGNRVKKTEGGETILYVNKYYEKNLTTGVVITNYYLGSQLVAQLKGTDLQYLHQDHLGGTSVISDSSGNKTSTISYFPFGYARSGSVPTDIKFTGQRLDSSGLYYYNARYYDPNIGRFISGDSIVPDPLNPQALNRYSYVLNNPLRYSDPSGNCDTCPSPNPSPSPSPDPSPGCVGPGCINCGPGCISYGMDPGSGAYICVCPDSLGGIFQACNAYCTAFCPEGDANCVIDCVIDCIQVLSVGGKYAREVRHRQGKAPWGDVSFMITNIRDAENAVVIMQTFTESNDRFGDTTVKIFIEAKIKVYNREAKTMDLRPFNPNYDVLSSGKGLVVLQHGFVLMEADMSARITIEATARAAYYSHNVEIPGGSLFGRGFTINIPGQPMFRSR